MAKNELRRERKGITSDMRLEICRVFAKSFQHDLVFQVLIRCVRNSSLYVENVVYHTMNTSPLVAIPLHNTLSADYHNEWLIAMDKRLG